ncbi:hypothetical protein ACTJIJ_19885 [Niabella sp. 22666]|uniref:hypothetical protein n=1 Tax=Niabella sp. 22666 TaxID=3453954 RepID=UPI003F8357DE
MSEDLIKCPKCGSTQISAQKKGFSGKKAVAGAILTGGIGILAGTLGSNKIKLYCLACGNSWLPSQYQEQAKKENERQALHDRNNERQAITDFIDWYEAGNAHECKKLYSRIKASDYDDISQQALDAFYRDMKSKRQKERKQSLGCLLFVIIITIVAIIVYNYNT